MLLWTDSVASVGRAVQPPPSSCRSGASIPALTSAGVGARVTTAGDSSIGGSAITDRRSIVAGGGLTGRDGARCDPGEIAVRRRRHRGDGERPAARAEPRDRDSAATTVEADQSTDIPRWPPLCSGCTHLDSP
jgi:hypothetical protein